MNMVFIECADRNGKERVGLYFDCFVKILPFLLKISYYGNASHHDKQIELLISM